MAVLSAVCKSGPELSSLATCSRYFDMMSSITFCCSSRASRSSLFSCQAMNNIISYIEVTIGFSQFEQLTKQSRHMREKKNLDEVFLYRVVIKFAFTGLIHNPTSK